MPLYTEEMNFKLKNNGADALLAKLEKAGVDEKVDIKRKNVCK
ncbi:suppressor of fused domain protein [Paenibacillus sp. IHBB 10380]